MALVTPLDPSHDEETQRLADFYNETLGFCPNSVLTMQRRPEISKAFIKGESAGCASCGGGCHNQIPEFPLDEKS